MTFTNTLGTDIGNVRLYLGDDTSGTGVLPDGSNFTDEQIQEVLDGVGSNLFAASAYLARSLAARWAIVPDKFEADGLRIDRSARVKQWSQLADQYSKLGAGGELATVGLDRRDGWSVAQEEGGHPLKRVTDTTYTDS